MNKKFNSISSRFTCSLSLSRFAAVISTRNNSARHLILYCSVKKNKKKRVEDQVDCNMGNET